jgi:hypothetical protein
MMMASEGLIKNCIFDYSPLHISWKPVEVSLKVTLITETGLT